MAIYVISGPPGGGKTWAAVDTIVQTLLHSERKIVTNIAINEKGLHEHLRAAGFVGELSDRLYVLERDETLQFYRFRGPAEHLPPFDETALKKSDKVAFLRCVDDYFRVKTGGVTRDVSFFIDEAHIFFNSREWADYGRLLNFYVRQHRHLGDDIYLISQHVEDLDASIKRAIETTIWCTDMRKRAFFGVSERPRFRVRYYNGIQTPGVGRSVQHFEEQSLYKNSGIGDCYHTTGNLGGREPEKQPSKWRLPWWSLYVLGAAGIAAVWFGISWGRTAVASLLGGTQETLAVSSQPPMAAGKFGQPEGYQAASGFKGGPRAWQAVYPVLEPGTLEPRFLAVLSDGRREWARDWDPVTGLLVDSAGGVWQPPEAEGVLRFRSFAQSGDEIRLTLPDGRVIVSGVTWDDRRRCAIWLGREYWPTPPADVVPGPAGPTAPAVPLVVAIPERSPAVPPASSSTFRASPVPGGVAVVATP